MKKKLQSLIEAKKTAHDRMVAIDKSAEGRDYTAEETAEWDKLSADIDKVDVEIRRTEKLLKDASDLDSSKHEFEFKSIEVAGEKKEFSCLAEMVHSVRFFPNDRRLVGMYTEFEGRTDQTMGTGAQGGYAVPDKFRPGLLSVGTQAAQIRPRAQKLGVTDPPDAKITIPALDQEGTTAAALYGGVKVYKISEGATLTQTDAKLREISWEPQGLGAYAILTNKLIRNWAAASSVIEGLLAGAMTGYEELQFLAGNGVGGPQGAIDASCTIAYSRATASTIVAADVNGMFARFKFGGSPIWMASQTTLPQLVTLRDTNNNNLFVMDMTQGIPASLLGIPLIFHDRSPALGTKGDLILCDWNYYLIQDGSGPYIATSEQLYFLTDRSVIRIIWNVDGRPWLKAALPLEGAPTNTVSPFVVLS